MITHSRWMRELARSSTTDPASAEEELFRQLAFSQGPLIEDIPGTDRVEVTFAYVHDGPALSLRSPLVTLVPGADPDYDIVLDRVSGTRIWYTSIEVDHRIATTYQYRLPGDSTPSEELEAEYSLLRDPVGLGEFSRGMLERGRADPANPDRLFPVYGVLAQAHPAHTASERFESVLTLPGADAFRSLTGIPRGTIVEYPFFAAASGTRTVAVYLPPGYNCRRRYPLVVALDGEYYQSIGQLPDLLDDAIARGTIPPVIVAFWCNRDASSRLQEFTSTRVLISQLVDELWPWLDAQFSVSVVAEQRIIAGFSLGGLAAAWIGLQRPEVFGGVIATSPSLWFSPDRHAPQAEPSWLAREFAEREAWPAVYLSVGSLETGPLDRVGSAGTMLELARNFAAVLNARPRARVGYCEVPGGHDYVNVRRATVQGLAMLLN